MISRFGGLLAALLGLGILWYGAKLVLVGGSPFYVLLGLGLTASGVLLLLRRQFGLWVYALTLAVTFIWTLYEVGFDKWQWIPRGALVIFLGVLLSLPFVTNSLRDRPVKPWAPRLTNGVLALRAVVLIIAALGVVSWFYDPLSIEGKLQKAATADAATDPSGLAYPADDWTAYGGTNLGQRYSALKEVNIGNVKGLKVAWEHHTGDLRKADQDSSEYTFEATPIKSAVASISAHRIISSRHLSPRPARSAGPSTR